MMTYEDLCDSLIFDDKKIVYIGYYVDSKIYRRFLLEKQNKIIRDGKLIEPEWRSYGSGVYRVRII